MKSPIRILTVDGGGVGGILPARILERLQTTFPNLIAQADLVAGTSTGGLIALGLARGLAPSQLCDLYLNECKNIFSRSNRRYEIEWPLKAKYVPTGLLKAVHGIVGDTTLGDLNAVSVLVPITAVQRPGNSHKPAGVFLSTAFRLINDPSKEKYYSSQWKSTDVALATAAAPTYFPAHHVVNPSNANGGKWICWDGGIVANNPALAAVGEIYRLDLAERNIEVRADHADVPDIRVLSIGTGYRDIPIDAGDWGLLQAARPVVRALMDTSVGSTAFLLRQFLGAKAARVSIRLPSDYEMDDASVVDSLNQLAVSFCENSLTTVEQPDGTTMDLTKWINTFWL